MIRRLLSWVRPSVPEVSLPQESAPRPTTPPVLHWLVLVAHDATRERALCWTRGLRETGARVSVSCRDGGELPGEGTPLPWKPSAWRTAIEDASLRHRVLVLLPDPALVAFAREARAIGARVIYDKIAPVHLPAEPRAFHPQDEQALVAACDDRIAADGPTARLLTSLGGRGGLVHEMADAVAAGRGLGSVVEKPTMTLVLVADPEMEAVHGAVDRWLEVRGLHAYRLAVVVGPHEGAALDRLLEREASGDLRVLRDPRGTPGSAVAMGVRATEGEVVAVVHAEQVPSGEGWLREALVALHSDAGLGAVGLGSLREAEGPAPVLPLFGWVARRSAVLDAGGFAEDLSGEAATAIDFSLRLARRGFRIESVEPAVEGRIGDGGLSVTDRERLRQRWRADPERISGLLG